MPTIQTIKIHEMVPEGHQDEASICHIEVDAMASIFTAFRAVKSPLEYVACGKYTQLRVHGTLMMSDTTMERETNKEFTQKAHGLILVAGLGIGLILFPLLDREDIEHITIVEKSQGVIDLVGPALKAKFGDRLEIVCEDIFKWKPAKGQMFDTIYFDIWPSICVDNLKDITRLHRKFRRYLNKTPRAWMDSWVRSELLVRRRRDKKEAYRNAYYRRMLGGL